MYGTILRVRMKHGGEEALKALLDEFEARRVPGFIGNYTYRLDADPRVNMTAIVFASKEAYVANANSPEQAALYERMAALFDGEPEWFDGEIIDVRGSVPRG
jgi:antibiotic biosynthesis monooxygenase (ABM) superfamily enzyme